MLKRLDIGSWVTSRNSGVERVAESVSEIIAKVEAEGDAALFELTERFDKVRQTSLAVDRGAIDDAYDEVDPELVEALEDAAFNIQRFHELQMRDGLWLKETEPGVLLGMKTTPLRSAGIYVPGGKAVYASSVLMCSIPARVAGVEELVMCTPPPIDPLTLVAADIAGVDEVFAVGGAQAVAAMALGTETVPQVDKVVGPGNVYVTAAKALLRGVVEIDFLAGPSEIGIIADDSGNAEFIAADMLAQAEHDPQSACVLVTDSEPLVKEVISFLEAMLPRCKRSRTAEQALALSGYVLVDSMEEAVEVMDRMAPEHLSLQVRDSMGVLAKVRNAGSIFVGPYAAVALGDYGSGTNHVLPTGGNAAYDSGLNVAHFCKTSSVQVIDREGMEGLADMAISLAEAEGLDAHAMSVRVRRSEQP